MDIAGKGSLSKKLLRVAKGIWEIWQAFTALNLWGKLTPALSGIAIGGTAIWEESTIAASLVLGLLGALITVLLLGASKQQRRRTPNTQATHRSPPIPPATAQPDVRPESTGAFNVNGRAPAQPTGLNQRGRIWQDLYIEGWRLKEGLTDLFRARGPGFLATTTKEQIDDWEKRVTACVIDDPEKLAIFEGHGPTSFPDIASVGLNYHVRNMEYRLQALKRIINQFGRV
ncbi:MAG: hypothetical protein WD602_06455 [Actinomycetota bacterium]